MRLRSEDILRIGEKLYLFASNMNMLYTIDVNTGEYDFLGKIPNKSISDKRLISGIVEWNDILYLLPLNSGDIWKYSINKKSWDFIEIETYENNWANSYFRNALVYEEKMYIFGGYYPAILILDLKTNKINYDMRPFNEKKGTEVRDLFFRGLPTCIGSDLYFASAIDNSILKYSLSDDDFEWQYVGSKENRYSGIEWDGESFWLAPRQSNMPVVKVTGERVEAYKLPNSISENECKYIGICNKGDSYIVPAGIGGAGSFLIDKSGKIEKTAASYTVVKKQSGDLFGQYVNGDVFYIDEYNNKSIFSGVIDRESFMNIIKKYAGLDEIHVDKVLHEETLFGLNEWINYLLV